MEQRGALNEEYNGTAWTEKGDLNSGRTSLAASQRGTITAGLVFEEQQVVVRLHFLNLGMVLLGLQLLL